jgi:antitoxin YefM
MLSALDLPEDRSELDVHRSVPLDIAPQTEGGREVTDMTTIVVMSETLPLAQVKSKFSEMVDRVEHTHDRIVVTRNGRPAAVIISPDELASLEDTLELLSNPDAMRELDDARRAAAEGDYITGDELRARFPAK